MTCALELECCPGSTVRWGRWLCAAVYISQCKLLDYHSLMSTMSRDHIGLDYFHSLTNLGVIENQCFVFPKHQDFSGLC